MLRGTDLEIAWKPRYYRALANTIKKDQVKGPQ